MKITTERPNEIELVDLVFVQCYSLQLHYNYCLKSYDDMIRL